MPKIQNWDETKAQKELSRRLNIASLARAEHEVQWEKNENAIYGTQANDHLTNVSLSFDSDLQIGDMEANDIQVNYVFKNFRMIHSQLSANPPSVVPRPTSSDYGDKRKADAADRVIRWSTRKFKMQEKFDKLTVHTLGKGTGYIKTVWDEEGGDIVEVKEDGEVEMEGEISIAIPNPWNIFPDPDADSWDEVRYVFERLVIPAEQAEYMFPDKKDLIEKLKESSRKAEGRSYGGTNKKKYDVVEIFQYWEKGLPYNGMLGRFCWCTSTGELLSEVGPNPHAFQTPADRGLSGLSNNAKSSEQQELPPIAELPYHQFTDVDLPDGVYGKAVVAFETPLQDIVNKLDNTFIDILQAHGIARLILPEGAEISDDSITNSTWDVIKMTGSQPPHFMSPLPMPPSLMEARERMKMGIDDMAGVNESMFGQQSRETSGFSMQYATNQGNMIRRRLFNKYVQVVESVYNTVLKLVRDRWTTQRTVYVLGAEKAFEAFDLKGADLDGGYDLIVEYGASLSLDPTARREEILTLMPLFEKAGVPPRQLLRLMKLNDLSGAHDLIQLAEDRQSETFREMVDQEIYIPPVKFQEHGAMLEYCYTYIMTAEFKYLPEDSQNLIYRHIEEREQLAAAGAQPPEGQAPMPLPPGLT